MASSWKRTEVDGSDIELYFRVPEGDGPFPGVVVIHHGYGVDQFTRDIADRLASEGYATVAPDLFHRVTASMLADGSARWDHLRDSEVVSDVNAAADFLMSQPSIDSGALGITGFCMGGRVAYLMTTASSHFKGAVVYYGADIMGPWGDPHQTPFDLTDRIACPLMFHFGELDDNPSPADMAKLDEELSAFAKPHQFFTYPGAGHAFMNHTGSTYDRAAAEASWPRSLDFFSAHLKGAASM